MTQALTTSNDIDQIADEELLAQLQRLVHTDQALTARLLVQATEAATS